MVRTDKERLDYLDTLCDRIDPTEENTTMNGLSSDMHFSKFGRVALYMRNEFGRDIGSGKYGSVRDVIDAAMDMSNAELTGGPQLHRGTSG
jgi:hypothetical protein